MIKPGRIGVKTFDPSIDDLREEIAKLMVERDEAREQRDALAMSLGHCRDTCGLLGFSEDIDAEFRSRIRRERAEAWDEGFRSNSGIMNPYRDGGDDEAPNKAPNRDEGEWTSDIEGTAATGVSMRDVKSLGFGGLDEGDDA